MHRWPGCSVLPWSSLAHDPPETRKGQDRAGYITLMLKATWPLNYRACGFPPCVIEIHTEQLRIYHALTRLVLVSFQI
jgi:hypothetical protein